MFCIQCGQQLESDSQFCISCGAKTPESDNQSAESSDNSFCIQCGEQLLSDSLFCTTCGAKVEDVPPEESAGAIEDWLVEAAAVEVKTKPAADSPAQTTQREMPLPQKPVIEPAAQVPDEYVSTDVVPNAPSKQRKLILIFGGVTVVLLAVVVGLIIFIARGDSPYVNGREGAYHMNRVARGHLEEHTNITIGAAFERFFTNFEWNYFSDGDVNYVSFHGDMQRDGETVMAQFIFQFTDNDEDFEVIVLVLGGVMQDILVINELLDYIFASVR